MNRKLYLLTAILSGWCLIGQAQDYKIGSSTVSIEPGKTIFSAALAGYGAPREGRFSITWKYISNVPDLVGFTTINGRFYAANKSGQLLEGTPGKEMVIWKNLGSTKMLTGLAASKGKLYAVSTDHQLLVANPAQPAHWKTIGKKVPFAHLTLINNRLFAAGDKNDLYNGTVSNTAATWKANGPGYRIISITNDGNRVYYLNAGDTMWRSNPGWKYKTWKEIGRNNSYNFNIHPKHLAVLNGKLYAVSDENKLYVADHSTKGNLSVRTLAVKTQAKTILIITLDVTGFNRTFTQDVKAELLKKWHLPESAILINASHTHFAPVTQAWTCWGDFYHTPDSIYLNKVVKRGIIRSVQQAMASLTPADIYFARGKSNIGENRRGSSNLLKPYDKTLDVLKISHASGKNEILFSAGCHPVFNNDEPNSTFTLTANYPGVAKRLIEEKTGDRALFVQGFGGDINPREMNYDHTGKELAGDVLELLKGNMQKISGGITYSIDTVRIPVKPWSLKQVLEFKADNVAAVEIEKKNTPPYTAAGQFTLTQLLEREKNVRWANLMIERYKKHHSIPKTIPLYVQVINIGDWKLVGLSREVTTEYAAAIRNFWPKKIVTVAGYCNDVPSYLPRDWHIHDKTYEGYDSFFWYGQPALPPANIREIVLNGIKKLNR